MGIFWINPLNDPRWIAFVQSHPSASIFHTPGWLEVLRRTYGFKPVVLTTSPPGNELRNGIPFCRIDSWLTGRRLVSLPFSDHCMPLVDNADDLQNLNAELCSILPSEKWKYIELRPSSGGFQLPGFVDTQTFYLHTLDLQPPLDMLLNSFHKNCVQRKMRRAERDGLFYQEGRSEPLLRKFYRLQLLARRHQKLPPQPFSWFKNLAECLEDKMTVRIASKEDQPIAAIITLHFRNTMTYKYGCSDPRYNKHGGMHFLFWKAIQDAKILGLNLLDMGRSDCDNQGLVTFKDRWGAAKSIMTYLRCPALLQRDLPNWKNNLARTALAYLPDNAFSIAGALLYRHLG